MNLRTFGIGAVIALGVAAAGGAANANITTVTITGHTSSDDPFGYFTNGGQAALAGSAFTYVQTMDDTTVGAIVTPTNFYGGVSFFGPDHPSPGSSVLTINGISFIDSGTHYAQIYTVGYQFTASTYFRTLEPSFSETSVEFNFVGVSSPYNYLDTYDTDLTLANNYISKLKVYDPTNFTNSPGAEKDVFLTSEHLCMSTNGAVCGAAPTPAPEPETWSLMIAGFAGLGLALRHRRARPPMVRLAR